MIYETPICEVVKIEEVDIICTSPTQPSNDVNDTPMIDLPLG